MTAPLVGRCSDASRLRSGHPATPATVYELAGHRGETPQPTKKRALTRLTTFSRALRASLGL